MAKLETLVLERQDNCPSWVATDQLGRRRVLEITKHGKAAAAAYHVMKRHPGVKVGVKSKEFGPATQIEFGDVVWIAPTFVASYEAGQVVPGHVEVDGG